MLRRHKGLILNWFRANGTLSSVAVEGLNNKEKLTIKKAYGFSSIRMPADCLISSAWGVEKSPYQPTDTADEPYFIS
jgi:hypothetical protein